MAHYDEYDALGRVKKSRQVTDGLSYSLSYEYNRAGSMTKQVYPSGRTISTAVDAAGRVNEVAGQKTGEVNRTYASLASYAVHGPLASLKLGNNLWEHSNFNARLQPVEIGLGNTASSGEQWLLTYAYTGGCQSANNGNLLSQVITLQTPAPAQTMTQSYCYDPLNRLISASESSSAGGNQWSHTYAYDRFGNRAAASNLPMSPLTPTQLTDYNANTNRLIQIGTRVPEYDAAGNLTKDTESPANVFEYDGENRLVKFNNGAASYGYDGEGRRVKKVSGTKTTWFVYNAAGQLVAEYANPAPTASGGISYLTSDHLGSTRIVTDSAGAVKTRHDFYPFGEEVPGSVGNRSTLPGYPPDLVSGPNQKFTAKERDSESNLDYFGARYFSGAQGRFTSTDAPFADQYESEPQSWNLYHYGRNNPLRFTDPTGRKCVDTSNGKADDGTGGGCAEAGVDANGNIKSQQVTVYADPLIDDLRFQLFRLEFNRANDANMKAAGLLAAGSALIGITGGLGANALYHPAILTSLRLSAPLAPEFGRKLDYLFGQATGNLHNVQRSVSMLQELRKIGINDTAEARAYVANHLTQILNDTSSIIQRGGDRTVRESFLMGPTGGAKLESVWEGTKLITVKIFGGGS